MKPYNYFALFVLSIPVYYLTRELLHYLYAILDCYGATKKTIRTRVTRMASGSETLDDAHYTKDGLMYLTSQRRFQIHILVDGHDAIFHTEEMVARSIECGQCMMITYKKGRSGQIYIDTYSLL